MSQQPIAICTICSRAKNEVEGLLPARQRYLGSHIPHVEGRARQHGLPFFILSGVYGLLAAEEGISYYDHVLGAEEILALAFKVYRQLKHHALQELHFFTESHPSWKPYLDVLQLATESLGVRLCVHELSESD